MAPSDADETSAAYFASTPRGGALRAGGATKLAARARRSASTSRRREATSNVMTSPSSDERDWPASLGLGGDVTGHHSVGGAAEAAVGHEATVSPSPRPTSAAVTASISRMPGPPRGPS